MDLDHRIRSAVDEHLTADEDPSTLFVFPVRVAGSPSVPYQLRYKGAFFVVTPSRVLVLARTSGAARPSNRLIREFDKTAVQFVDVKKRRLDCIFTVAIRALQGTCYRTLATTRTAADVVRQLI